MANKSQIIREGIALWRQANDPVFKDQRIKKIEKEIKMKSEELNELKEEQKQVPARGREILERWLPKFNQWRTDETEDFMAAKWIHQHVIPELRAAGCKDLQSRTILDMFLRGRVDVGV